MIFNRMRLYTVHVKPEDTGDRFRPVFLKEGFNWFGFILPLVWALFNRLWLVSFAVAIIEILMLSLLKAHVFTHFSVMALQLVIHIFVGLQGNDWIRSKLYRKGYIVSDVSAADNFLHAQQRYLERYVVAAHG